MSDKLKVMFKKAGLLTASGAAVMVATTVPAHAAIDVSDVLTGIGEVLSPINSIGAAVILVFVAVKAWKWIRMAIS